MRRTALAAALALSAALAAPALAGVDVEVPATFKAKGILDPSEVETFRFHAEKGTTLTLAAAPAKGSGLLLDVRLEGSGGTVAIPPEFVVAAAGKVSWKAFPLPATDDYRLVLSGEGAGGYSLSLKGKVKTAWTSTLNFPGSPTVHFLFSAPTGSTVALSAKPAKGSPVIARFGALLSPGSSTDLSTAGKTTPTGQSAAVGPLESGGDCDLTIVNSGASGDVVVAAKVKPPRVKPGKLDLRPSVLGRPSGGETLVGRVVDGGGGSVTVDDGASDIFGAQVDLPAGALASATLVSVASTVDPPLGSGDDQAAGPAVRLEPSGLVFPVPVDVTLPFDFTKIPAGSTPDDIRIRIVEDNGSATEVAPSSVGANTVTIPTNGFSVCIPIIVSGSPTFGYTSLGTLKPGGDEFWMLEMSSEINPGGGNDSRNRRLEASVGQIALYGDGTVDFSLANHGFQWSNQDSPPMSGQPIQSGLTEYTDADGGTLNWAYDATGTKIVLSGTPDNTPVFRVSRDGRYLAGAHEGLAEPYTDVQFCARKNTKALTTASLKGVWTGCLLEVEGNQQGSSGAAAPKLTRAYGNFTFDGAGGVDIAFTQRRTSFNEANGSIGQNSESINVKDSTYSIDGDGTIVVVVPAQSEDDQGTTLRVFPGDGLDVLFATHDPPLGESCMSMVLVRQGDGLSRGDLAGRYHGVNYALDAGYYGVPSTPLFIGDFSINVEALVGTFDGGAAADFAGDRFHAQRDPGQPVGTLVENDAETFSVAVSVSSQGKTSLAADGKVVGQITPDGQAAILVSDNTSAESDFGLLFLFRSPPVKTP